MSRETPPQSSLQSGYKRLRNAILDKINATQRFNPSSILGSISSAHSPVRYDLDACDIQEKYPDLFQVNLNIEVDPRDKPSTKPPPWEGFQTKGLNPKILFSTRDEQQEILSKFGKGCSSLKTSVVFLTRCTREVNVKTKISTGKPELPRQPGSSAFYDSEASQPAQTPEGSTATEPESPASNDTNTNNFFQTLDWEGAVPVYSFHS